MWHAAKNIEHINYFNNRVSATPTVRFLVRCHMRYAMRKNESLHVMIHAACECEFAW